MEVLISAVIVIIILAALVFLGRSALAGSSYSEERTQAIYLAQEGLEIARQIRDTNWISSDPKKWDYFDGSYSMMTDVIHGLGDGDTEKTGKISYDSSSYRYKFETGQGESIAINRKTFTRKISFTKVGDLLPEDAGSINKDENAVVVKVKVEWTNNQGSKSLEASEILTNWRPNF